MRSRATWVDELLPSVTWKERLEWPVTEPVLLFDSVYTGTDALAEEHLRIELEPGEYLVEAAHAEHPDAYLILVRLTARPDTPAARRRPA
ncbi:Imm21 family immunity protein [Actinoplanes italicus]|uniref:Imm21 family immunity protein n=1 Tax=Actinoplanes italicus TaxID=113567 RepID=UPI001474E337|nr:Imm21 family immunity protein [Actinoplanes italicus]